MPENKEPPQNDTTITTPKPYYISPSPICKSDTTGKIAAGRGVFAARSFNASEPIATFPRPLVGSLDTERLVDTCANCYAWTEGGSTGTRLYVPEGAKVQACAGCKRMRYCSKKCQKASWHHSHKPLCKTLAPVSDKEIPKAVLACVEILLRKKHNLISPSDWDLLLALDTHIEDFKRNGKYGGIELMALGVSQFPFTQGTFSKDFVAEMYARVLTNSMTLVTPTFDPLGIMMDPVLSCMNHSCDPNAFVVMDGAQTAIRTLRPIAKDEEIYMSYIDTTAPVSRRQSELEARWFFTCKCTKCEKDKVEQTTTSTPTPEQIDQAYQQYEETQRVSDPTDALNLIKDAMENFPPTYPLHHQPHAALISDFILHLLSISSYKAAWPLAAKRHKHILPIHYPVPHHPIRVVQTWQMAMLSVYLASTGEPVEGFPGANMGAISLILVNDVLENAGKSHGTDSAFWRSVKGKREEMMRDLKAQLGEGMDGVMRAEMERQKRILDIMGGRNIDGQ